MNKLVNAFIRKAVEQRFLIAENVSRITHAETDAVFAAHVRENSLREFGEVCADVKTVTGAVLAGELDFEATVIDERLDLIDDNVRRKAVESAFDEMCAAEGAGVQTALFDVHDADVGRFAKDGSRTFIVIVNAIIAVECVRGSLVEFTRHYASPMRRFGDDWLRR